MNLLMIRVRKDDGELRFLPTTALRSLANLHELHVQNAHIDVVDADAFRNLTSLQALHLKRNNVRSH